MIGWWLTGCVRPRLRCAASRRFSTRPAVRVPRNPQEVRHLVNHARCEALDAAVAGGIDVQLGSAALRLAPSRPSAGRHLRKAHRQLPFQRLRHPVCEPSIVRESPHADGSPDETRKRPAKTSPRSEAGRHRSSRTAGNSLPSTSRRRGMSNTALFAARASAARSDALLGRENGGQCLGAYALAHRAELAEPREELLLKGVRNPIVSRRDTAPLLREVST